MMSDESSPGAARFGKRNQRAARGRHPSDGCDADRRAVDARHDRRAAGVAGALRERTGAAVVAQHVHLGPAGAGRAAAAAMSSSDVVAAIDTT